MDELQSIIQTRSYRVATEDRAAVIEHPEGRVIVIADGVGGHSGGARAAELLVTTVSEKLPTMSSLQRSAVWCELLESADSEIRADKSGGETTAVVLAITPSGIVGAAVGDSEVWLIPTSSQPVVLAGRSRRKPYLGFGAAIPEPFASKLAANTLLVATDGLFKYVDAKTIASISRQPDLQVAATALADLPRSSRENYPDDLALVVCRLVAT